MGNVKKIHIQDMQPVLMIAKYPRATIRFCLMFKPLLYFFFIGVVGMFGFQLIQFIQTPYQARFTLGDVVFSSMVMSVLMFTMSTLILAGIIQLFSKMLSGKGTFKQMFRALALSYVPFIWILPILLFWMQLSPESYFVISGFEPSSGGIVMTYIGSIIVGVALIWNILLVFKAIQEVQRISLLRTMILFTAVVVVMLGVSTVFYSSTGLHLF